MKKIVALLLLLCTFALVLSSCGVAPELQKPKNTNLEYWLFDYVDIFHMTNIEHTYSRDLNAFSRYQVKWYLSDKYTFQHDENGDKVAPDEAVVYRFERFPVAEFGVLRVTGIEITDPNVSFYGLNINSSYDEILTRMQEHGYSHTTTAEVYRGKYVSFDNIENSIHVIFYYEKGIIEIEYDHIFHLAYLGLLFGD